MASITSYLPLFPFEFFSFALCCWSSLCLSLPFSSSISLSLSCIASPSLSFSLVRSISDSMTLSFSLSLQNSWIFHSFASLGLCSPPCWSCWYIIEENGWQTKDWNRIKHKVHNFHKVCSMKYYFSLHKNENSQHFLILMMFKFGRLQSVKRHTRTNDICHHWCQNWCNIFENISKAAVAENMVYCNDALWCHFWSLITPDHYWNYMGKLQFKHSVQFNLNKSSVWNEVKVSKWW